MNTTAAAHIALPTFTVVSKETEPNEALSCLSRIASGERVIDVYRNRALTWEKHATPEKVEETVSDPTFQGYTRLIVAIS